ncbi:MAG: C1 family peptidase [Bifidobacterium sp.]|nr:C1 family peptidase [Bifidobacterium sp.]
MTLEAQTMAPLDVDGCPEDFAADRANLVARTAATSVGVLPAATSDAGIRALPREFSLDLKAGKATNQKRSGRCWMFGGLNALRYETMHAWKLDDFEFSESYLYFWETLEKANMYLEQVLATLDEPSDSRLFEEINLDPGADGGWFSLFAQLVEKYGLMPKSAYPEVANSSDSDDFKQYLKTKLREIAAELRAAHANGATVDELAARKADAMRTVYRMTSIALGEPPATFDFLARREKDDDKPADAHANTDDIETAAAAAGARGAADAKKTEPPLGEPRDGRDDRPQIRDFHLTPQEFARKYVSVDVRDYVTICNAPMARTPFDTLYSLELSGSIAGGRDVEMANLDLPTFKATILRQLKAGHPVTFACDCTQFALRKQGVFAREAVRVDELFGTDFAMDKGAGLEYLDRCSNHIMTITGVDFDDKGEPDRWKIENSWGKDVGDDGYFVASDDWFDEFVTEADVRREFLDDKTKAVFEQQPVRLALWTPLSRSTRCR